jgi:hypothetical protein
MFTELLGRNIQEVKRRGNRDIIRKASTVTEVVQNARMQVTGVDKERKNSMRWQQQNIKDTGNKIQRTVH